MKPLVKGVSHAFSSNTEPEGIALEGGIWIIRNILLVYNINHEKQFHL